MKVNRKYLSVVLMLTIQIFAFGQKPFQHRFSVAAQQGVSFVDIISAEPVNHTRAEFTLNLNKSLMVGVEGNFSYASYDKYTSPSLSENYDGNWLETPTIQDLTVGLKLYYFRTASGSRAPSGRYFFSSLHYGKKNSFYQTDSIQVAPNPVNNNVYIINHLNKDVKEKIMLLSLGFGRNYIVHKNILLGYCFEVGIEFTRNIQDPFEYRHFMKPMVKIGYAF